MKRLTYEYIKQQTEEGGEKLLSDSYVNNSTLLLKLCIAGHEYETDWKRHVLGKRCRKCDIIKRADRYRLDYDTVKQKMEENGDRLLSSVYINNSTLLDILCTNAHIFPMTWSNCNADHRCPVCAGNDLLKIEYVRTRGNALGYILLSDNYINSLTNLMWMGKDCKHEFPAKWGNLMSGKGCPECAKKNNKWEDSTFAKLLNIFPYLLPRVKGLLYNKLFHLDVWDPVNRKAVELDGDRWHAQPKQAERDIRKNKECKKAGIKLLRIKYSEYMKDPEGEFDKIVKFLTV